MINIKTEVEDSWFKWMREIHIPDVMNTGFFIDWQLQKLLLPETDEDESSYVINYLADTIEKCNQYLNEEAPRLQQEHSRRFSGKFKAQRTIYYLIPK
jgi:hypothetical protein